MKGSSAPGASTDEMAVTGSMPRPVSDRSVGLFVLTSAPLASMSQIALVVTPPALKPRPPPGATTVRVSLTVIEAKSTSERLYPKVCELAMLSEIVASLFAFAFRPETPAFIEEEMPILQSFVREGSVICRPHPWAARLKIPLT